MQVRQNGYEMLVLINEEISSAQGGSEVLDRVLDYAIETLSAESGFILLKNNADDPEYNVVAARNMSHETISRLRSHSSSIVRNVLESGKPLLSVDAETDNRFQNSDSVMLHQIKSVICTPLILNDALMGAIYMDNRAAKNKYDEDSLNFLSAFARQTAIAISNAQMIGNLKTENNLLKKQVSTQTLFPEIKGNSRSMHKIFELIRDVADTSATVLVEGESGTGKELVARALHQHSSRKDHAFMPIFCNGLSESLLESELFGHKKGAFSGAVDNRIGLFAQADKGTVFLDEISEISPSIQTKLLRVIQEGEIKRVGDSITQKIDVRIICATNKNLREEVEKGRFREDLFYRLNVISLKVPALRERSDDIPTLAGYFLNKYAEKNKKNVYGYSKEALRVLQEYAWPGNVRELENAIERAVILAKSSEIGVEMFEFQASAQDLPLGQTLDEINKYAVLKTIEMLGGNRTKAAAILGVSRRWLQYQLKDWGMINEN